MTVIRGPRSQTGLKPYLTDSAIPSSFRTLQGLEELTPIDSAVTKNKRSYKREITMATTVDVLIIGGGPAGLATALALSRKLHSVLLFDSQEYRNGQTSHMHNVLGFDVGHFPFLSTQY